MAESFKTNVRYYVLQKELAKCEDVKNVENVMDIICRVLEYDEQAPEISEDIMRQVRSEVRLVRRPPQVKSDVDGVYVDGVYIEHHNPRKVKTVPKPPSEDCVKYIRDDEKRTIIIL